MSLHAATLVKGVMAGLVIGLVAVTSASADVQEEIGLDSLLERLGEENMPTGAGVGLAQVESPEGTNYAPDGTNEHFTGMSFFQQSGSSGASGHATNVCQWMCGDFWSPAPGVPEVYCWTVVDWCTDGFIHANYGASVPPGATPQGVKNFNLSWVASFGSINNDHSVLRRADFVVERDNVLMCHALSNTGTTSYPLMYCLFNGISVGKVNGEHSTHDTSGSYDGGGRMRPEIVVPLSTTSASAGVVSGAVALLTETALTDPSLPPEAEDTEVLKAVLFNGASHVRADGTWTNEPETTGDLRGLSVRPIDNVVGAGTLNVDRSHLVLTGGRVWGGLNPGSPGEAGLRGWDNAFCLAGSSRWWKFTIDGQVAEVSIAASWNRNVYSDFESYALGNGELELWRIDEEDELVSLLGDGGIGVFSSGNVASRSPVDNVELLVIHDLAPGEYMLELHHEPSGTQSISAGIAWYFSDPEPVDTPGDTNGDGIVNIEDLLAVIAEWGCEVDCTADVNGDGIVNISDLLLVIANWG